MRAATSSMCRNRPACSGTREKLSFDQPDRDTLLARGERHPQ
jgi:hypothetical protein